MRTKLSIFALLLTFSACGPSAQVSERNADAASSQSEPDAGVPDASAPGAPDASTPGAPDASVPDASTPSEPDASAPDARAPNEPDAGAPDASAPDAGAPDAVVINQAPEIEGEPSTVIDGQAFEFAPNASDADGDDLLFSAESMPAWLSLNAANGQLSGTPGEADIGTHEFSLLVSDGELNASLSLSVVVRSALEVALERGDARGLVGEERLLRGLDDEIEDARTQFRAAKAEIFALNEDLSPNLQSLNNIDWNPTHDASILGARFSENEAILMSNDVTDERYDIKRRGLAVIGENASARYLVMGSNPMRNAYRNEASVNEQMHVFMERSLGWLMRRQDLDAEAFKVVIAHQAQSRYFPDEVAVRSWFDSRFEGRAEYNEAALCDDGALLSCLESDVELLVISGHESLDDEGVALSVAEAMRRGIAVLYLHYDGANSSLTQALFPLFDVTYQGDNYWRKLRLTSFDAASQGEALPADVEKTKALVVYFQDAQHELSLTECDDKSCPIDAEYNSLVLDAVTPLRDALKTLDEKNTPLFAEDKGRYEKLAVLLGDVFRQEVRFPMDKVRTPTAEFIRSIFADHVVYNSREINHAQQDLGNFGRSDFSHVTPLRREVSLVAKPNFRSTGAYALPGHAFQVTRRDESAVGTKVFINTLRSGATHEFSSEGYKRPKHLQSAHIEILPGQTLTLTSPYGGPIQVSFDEKDVPVDLVFENVGEHPYWSSSDDNQRFSEALQRGDYDWAELVTAAFEVHSTRDKMLRSVEDEKWAGAAAMAEATERYMSNLPHVLAGFQGPGIDSVDEITNFALSRNIEMETLDVVKHMNADQANCGYGCSGNPYDAYWAFSPTGHGDLHELGHGLEKSRLRFSGWEGHASTNPYSYYAKSIYRVDTVGTLDEADCQQLPFEELYATLQESFESDDPFAFMQAQEITAWNLGVAIQIQFMMSAEAEGVLENGWHLLARLHILERAFAQASRDDSLWLSQRGDLGFGNMEREAALALSNNDWNLIALSTATGRDMGPLLGLYGLETSDVAKAHVASQNLVPMPLRFFDTKEDDYCLDLDKATLPLGSE